MTTISKRTMCHLLYCLNWHIKDLWAEFYSSDINDDEKASLREQIKTLRALKEKVLAKLIMEGHAAIRGVQKNLHAKPHRNFYSIRLNRDFSFHLPLKEFKECLDEYEKTGKDITATGTQDGDF